MNKNKGFHQNRRFNTKEKFSSGSGRQKYNQPTKRLTEDEIGITEYTSDFEGFSGILKFRFSDFQVSEINDKGEIAKLTNTDIPKSSPKILIEEDEQLLSSKYNLELLPIETWDRIEKLSMNPEPTKEVIEIDATEMSKEHRTNIHDAVKIAFVNIVGKTENKGSKKLICLQKYRKGVRIDNRVKWVWPGEYVQFILYKENCDTMEAASKIASQLGIKPNMITYAGIKDRRAKTTQWFSIKKMEPSKILPAVNKIYGLKAGNIAFADYSLSLGMLRGNRFRIALRNVTAPIEVVTKGCELLEEKGFINYYGVQRFGTRITSPTYLIGLKILQNRFRDAVNHILEEYPLNRNDGKYTIFRGPAAPMLQVLNDFPNDVVGAFNQLPRNRRLLYVHAYQSLVWNRAASERVRRGYRALPGDLVLDSDNADEINKEVILEAVDDDIPELDVPEPNKSENEKKKNTIVPIKTLTEEDVESRKYTIFDIVLPLPGQSIVYPPNMKDFYEQLLKKDGLELGMDHRMKPYRLSGAYRLLVQRPQGLEWNVVGYDDPCCDLITSDLDQMNGKSLDHIDASCAKYKALLVNMTLPSSSYATMALRELLRVDTSGDFQAKQNDYHKSEKQLESDSIENKRKIDDIDVVDAKKPKIEDEKVDSRG